MANENSAATSTGRKRPVGWVQPLLIICAVVTLGLGYGLYSSRSTLQQRISGLETSLRQTQQEVTQFRTQSEETTTELASNLEVVTQRLGVATGDLQKARQQLAQRLNQQQQLVEQKLASELATKASSTDMETLRQEAASRLAEVQQDANAKLGSVSGEVSGVRQDLVATRQNFSRELLDVKNSLNDGIARNAAELAQLRRKGERDYIEVEIRKNQKPALQRVGEVQIALTKTDVKKQKYSVLLQVDDNRLEKKDRTANEPVQFLVGRDQLRYELVINSVNKDVIKGYLSTPKDKVLSAEGPTFRP